MTVWDRHSGRTFLVDSGAEESVFPVSPRDRHLLPRSDNLEAANGTAIATYGKRAIPLRLANGHAFTQTFWLADVTQPILGADFFITNRLAIDLAGRRLLSLDDLSPIPTKSTSNHSVSGLHRARSDAFEAILDEFPDLLVPHFSPQDKIRHNIEHHIVTEGPPLHARARRLDGDKLAVAKDEFRKMEEMGIIRRSDSPWASPLHIAPKPGGGWRPCGDFRRLNDATIDDRYPLPHIQDFNGGLAGKSIFSVIDLVRGFHHIPMAPDDIPKTAIITPFGLFEFLRMPFGLKNAAQAFQRLMDGILKDVDSVFVYLDDILVASSSDEEHCEHLRQVLRLLTANGITVNKQKCLFGQKELRYLGHLVSAGGVRPLPSRVDAIQDIPVPDSKVALQRFLSMINFYRRFMPRLAAKLGPLHDATKGKSKTIVWSSDCQTAFSAAKQALSDATLLHHPHPSAPTAITVDASDFALGAELSQQGPDKVWRPISFFSTKLSSAETKYSAFDRELLAIYAAIQHFRHHVEGRPFTVYTDHKPLTFAFSSSADRSPRQTRHLSYIAEYTTDVRHISGTDNVVADTLSRAVSSVNALALPTIDYGELAAAQTTSAEILAYRTAVSGLTLVDVPFNDNAFTVLCDTSTGHCRPVVPSNWTRRVFDAIHGLAHAGPRPCQRAVSKRFVWHGLKKDVRKWCHECHDCQASKIHRHVRAPLEHRAPPDRRFGSIHVDLVGPLTVSEGCKYLFTIVDRFTRWPEAIPLPDALTTTCARALLRGWISRFGIPSDITSDRGPQFTSHLWSELNKILGISASTTTAYHPQANGMVERMHRQLKSSLEARLTGPNWMDELPFTLLGLRCTWREGADCSPADLVYGCSLRIPGEFLPDTSRAATASTEFLQNLQKSMRSALPPPVSFHSVPNSQVPRSLANATHVYVRHDAQRHPLQRPYDGPYPVLKHGDKSFVINRNGEDYTVTVDRLKPAYGAGPVQPTPLFPATPAPPPSTPTLPPTTTVSSPPPSPKTSRSGRNIRRPARYR